MDIQKTTNSLEGFAEAAKTAKEVLPNTTSKIDNGLATIAEWFDCFVLYPLHKASVNYKYKLECFTNDLKEKTDQIPENQICEPKLSIAGPTLEALKYTYDEQSLREMYVNLLASSMDKRKTSITHPSFVEIIKKMDSFDALVFKYLASLQGYVNILNPQIRNVKEKKYFIGAAPEWFFGWTLPGFNIYQTSSSLVRLGKLGIIEFLFDKTTDDEAIYNQLKQSSELQNILETYRVANPTLELEVSGVNCVFYVNEIGIQFAKCCL